MFSRLDESQKSQLDEMTLVECLNFFDSLEPSLKARGQINYLWTGYDEKLINRLNRLDKNISAIKKKGDLVIEKNYVELAKILDKVYCTTSFTEKYQQKYFIHQLTKEELNEFINTLEDAEMGGSISKNKKYRHRGFINSLNNFHSSIQAMPVPYNQGVINEHTDHIELLLNKEDLKKLLDKKYTIQKSIFFEAVKNQSGDPMELHEHKQFGWYF